MYLSDGAEDVLAGVGVEKDVVPFLELPSRDRNRLRRRVGDWRTLKSESRVRIQIKIGPESQSLHISSKDLGIGEETADLNFVFCASVLPRRPSASFLRRTEPWDWSRGGGHDLSDSELGPYSPFLLPALRKKSPNPPIPDLFLLLRDKIQIQSSSPTHPQLPNLKLIMNYEKI